MLLNLAEILEIANKNKYAVGAFNTPNLEAVVAVIETAEKLNVPVILSHAQLHEVIMPLHYIGPIMIQFAKNASVPVCVHLDHGEDLDYLEKSLKLGFTSIMYDGSLLSYEENVSNTIKAVELAKKYNANVEAEIGVMTGREAGGTITFGKAEDLYTDPYLAERFVRETGIDALAASFGAVHGFYKTKPKLDFDRIEKISSLVKIPLVMHGGSGLSSEDFTISIKKGIRKINYYTYMAKAGANAVEDLMKEGKANQFHDMAVAAVNGMKSDIEKAMKVFCNLM